jgi:hypothetical protein
MVMCMVSLAALSSADTLVMRDGTRVEGTVVGIGVTDHHVPARRRRDAPLHDESGRSTGIPVAERANPRAVNGRRLDAPLEPI